MKAPGLFTFRTSNGLTVHKVSRQTGHLCIFAANFTQVSLLPAIKVQIGTGIDPITDLLTGDQFVNHHTQRGQRFTACTTTTDRHHRSLIPGGDARDVAQITNFLEVCRQLFVSILHQDNLTSASRAFRSGSPKTPFGLTGWTQTWLAPASRCAWTLSAIWSMLPHAKVSSINLSELSISSSVKPSRFQLFR